VNAASGLAESPEDLLGQAAGGILFVDDLAALSRLQQKNLAFIAVRGERRSSASSRSRPRIRVG